MVNNWNNNISGCWWLEPWNGLWLSHIGKNPKWLILMEHELVSYIYGKSQVYDFPYIGKNNPKWRTHIFQRGRYTTNQKWWVCEWCLMFPGCSNGEPRKVLEGINGTIFAYGPQHSIRDPRDPVRVEPREVVKWLLFHSHLTLLKELSHLAVHEMLA